ncbi:DUF6770 family protein [Flavobacterium crassostreae]|uniref:WG repeat-containing protein n=1 Tax=Flavobacterium crassostreae TaxID=1763534 RepID=A0A1B9E056_9FLAO|nr:DUF6770 family protein [Flavobacterium crassostreae]OCB75332.1 hypothetical protein LPBF_08020 [Flavobacterium crassostreae]
MKKTILFLLLFTSLSRAQSYTVLNNTAGELERFSPIYDHETLYGYVEVRKMNVDENLKNTFKYTVLDKNFNSICVGELTDQASKSKRYLKVLDVNYANGYLLFDLVEYAKSGGQESVFLPKTYQVVDLKNNVVINKGVPINEVYYNPIYSSTYSLDKTGFLAVNGERTIKNFMVKTVPFCALSTKGEKIWEYQNPRKYEKAVNYYSLKSYTENYIVLYNFFRNGSRNEVLQANVVVLDAKTGKELVYHPLESEYTVDCEYAFTDEDKLYIGGKFLKKNKDNYPHFKESLGIFQKVIDLKTNAIIRDSYRKNESYKDIKISEDGRVSGDGFLKYQKCNLNPDGTFFVLAESFRITQTGKNYTQLYTFLMDKDFNSVKTTEYNVKSTMGYKYYFSQRIANKMGRAYFFFDKNDNSNLELNILNHYYKSKKETIQKMPLTNKESSINVFPAKEGYVGIAEYFKDPKKEGKYMEIRLEKLNFERE